MACLHQYIAYFWAGDRLSGEEVGMQSISQEIVRESSEKQRSVLRTDLQPGDWLIVETRNSLYTIRVLNANHYLIAGGWFDKKGAAPFKTTIRGCALRGRLLDPHLIAAKGMFIEFGNGVRTSTVQEIRVVETADLDG